jgi:uncharacterized DUF497 family protein
MYNQQVHITYDPDKRARTLKERNLNFKRAVEVFSGLTLEVEDTRRDYGEQRILCVGFPEVLNVRKKVEKRSEKCYSSSEKTK